MHQTALHLTNEAVCYIIRHNLNKTEISDIRILCGNLRFVGHRQVPDLRTRYRKKLRKHADEDCLKLLIFVLRDKAVVLA